MELGHRTKELSADRIRIWPKDPELKVQSAPNSAILPRNWQKFQHSRANEIFRRQSLLPGTIIMSHDYDSYYIWRSVKKENELPTPSSVRKLRRRSKSANNLMDPYKNVKSTISTHMQQFRTPQAPRSRLPVKGNWLSLIFVIINWFTTANTAVRPKQKKESIRAKRILTAVNESQEEQKLMIGGSYSLIRA